MRSLSSYEASLALDTIVDPDTIRGNPPLLTLTDAGLYCPAGGFHIDPWRPVARALITHAHGDHACGGSSAYLAAAPGLPVLAMP